MTVNLPMLEATAVETVTVTAESPLLNVATSSLGGNVDPRQIQELPVNGRNWIGLARLRLGARRSQSTRRRRCRTETAARPEFQLNMDGPGLCRYRDRRAAAIQPDSIAEFQFLSNRFDATQGRSSGVLVNAITNQAATALPVTSEATSATANSTPTTWCAVV